MALVTDEMRSRPPPSSHHVEQFPDAGITVAHIQELIDTNKALRESVTTMAAMLREQSYGNIHNPGRRGSKDSGVFISHSPRSRQSSVSNTLVTGLSSWYGGVLENKSDRETQRLQYEDTWREVPLMPFEAVKEERKERRREYEARWEAPSLHEHAAKLNILCPSKLPPDDPWWNSALDPLRTNVSQFSPIQSRKLRSALQTELRYDLLIALFGNEFVAEWSSSSRALFEGSRRARLRDFLAKLQTTGAIAYFGDDLVRVAIEVAEWTKTIWSSDMEASQTLEGLRVHCYRHGVLPQPKANEYWLVEKQTEGFLALIYALDFRKSLDHGTQWNRVVAHLSVDSLPLEQLLASTDKLSGWSVKKSSRSYKLEPSTSINIRPEDFNVKTLRELGEIEIVWTADLELHLHLTPDAKKLFVFEYPTWLFGRQIDKSSGYHFMGSTTENNKIFQDLAQTYSLLFGPITKGQLKTFHRVKKADEQNTFFLGQRVWDHYADPENASIRDVNLYPDLYPARDFLENFRSVKISPGMAKANGLDPTQSTMGNVIARGAPYSDDIAVMMLSIMRYHRDSASLSFSGGTFEEQLRMIKTLMDGKRPRTLGQLWRDARDTTSWWTFWTVIGFGAITIFLALSSLIVSIVQTVGTYKAVL